MAYNIRVANFICTWLQNAMGCDCPKSIHYTNIEAYLTKSTKLNFINIQLLIELLQEATPLTPKIMDRNTPKKVQTIISSISECDKQTCVSLSFTPQTKHQRVSYRVIYKINGSKIIQHLPPHKNSNQTQHIINPP